MKGSGEVEKMGWGSEGEGKKRVLLIKKEEKKNETEKNEKKV